jgi:hypothetical protein
MAEYGLSVTNNSGSIVISSNYRVLVYSERGTFKITSQNTDREGFGQVVFLRPVLTQEPPQVFLRYASGVHNTLGIFTVLQGGPGNWTGFYVTSAVRGNPSLQNYDIEYVSCMYSDRPNASRYGLELRDGAGSIVYASSDRVVKYSKFSKSWTWTQGSSVDYYDSNLTIDADDFVAVTSIDRGVSWFTGGASYAGMTLMQNGVRMLRIIRNIPGGGLWFNQGTNGTCLAIPVCKFPIARYYN